MTRHIAVWLWSSSLDRWYLDRVAPIIGGVVTGDTEAYRYLAASAREFAPAEEIVGIMQEAGLAGVGFRRYALGTMALHWGHRPAGAYRPA